MKKLLLFSVLCTGMHINFGAAQSTVQEGGYRGFLDPRISDTRLEPEVVEMAIAHLPKDVNDFAMMIGRGLLTKDMVLFTGPAGIGKKTAAYAIGQRYYPEENVHAFLGTLLTCADDGRIDLRKFDSEMNPIIERAHKEPQFVIIHNFDVLIRIKKGMSREQRGAVKDLKGSLEDISNQDNIILVGLCHKTNKIPERLAQFFPLSLYRFDENTITPAFLSALLEYYLAHAETSHNISKEICDDLVQNFPANARKVRQLVSGAAVEAFKRDPNASIEANDIVAAVQEYNERLHAQWVDSWKRSLNKHSGTVAVGAGLLACAGLLISKMR